MTGSLETHIRGLAESGVQVNLWPAETGFTANVKLRATDGWICVTDADPVYALTEALRQRAAGMPQKVRPADEVQVDLEDAIAAVSPLTDSDGFCMICEGGGCDACRPAATADDGFDSL